MKGKIDYALQAVFLDKLVAGNTHSLVNIALNSLGKKP